MARSSQARRMEVPDQIRLKGDTKAAWMLILPFFLFFGTFVLYPLVRNIFTSLTSDSLIAGRFIGLANYRRMLEDERFIRSVINTLLFALAAVGPLLLLGFAAALCVRGSGRFLPPARSLLMLPYVLSMVSVSLIWLYLLDPGSGILNKLLRAVGLSGSDWLFDEHLALPCLIALHVWKNTGYVMIICLSAIQGISASLHEAARVDGASYLKQVWHVTLPGIRPVTGFLLATLFVECFKTFESVRIMTNGGPVNATTTITYQIYIRAFSEFKTGYASAMSIVLLAMALAVTWVNLRIGNRMDGERPDR